MTGVPVLVVVFCDDCGVEARGDYLGPSRAARIAGARAWLAANRGWLIAPGLDLCPTCRPDAPAAANDVTTASDLPDTSANERS